MCILFDDLATNAPKRNSIKNAFQNVSKSEKISEHEKKDCHNKALEKAKKFVMTFENKTKAVTHDKYNNDKCQKNLHILKLIIEAVMLFSEQGLAFRSHREQSNYSESYHEKRVNRGSFNAIINAFAKLDTIWKDHLENGAKNVKIASWKIQNDIIACLAEFIRKRIKDDISEYYAIIAGEVIDRFSNKEILLLCLRYVTFQNGLPIIHETFFDS